jgi:hypothetical protein
MGILKRASYEREHGKVSDIDYKLYLLRARPLSPIETQESRNKEITDLIGIKLKTMKGTLHKTMKGTLHKTMKGVLHKTESGNVWIVKWVDPLHGFGGAGWTPMEAELHPDSQKLKKLTEGKKVEFELAFNSNYLTPYDFTQYAKIILKKPHKPTTKDCERFIREWVSKFLTENIDKINTKKIDLSDSGTSKEKLLKDVKTDIEWAMWVLNEVMNWGMDKNYSKELCPTIYEPEDYEFWVIKLDDKYIKITTNKDYTHTVSFAVEKTKTVIYFE